MVDDAHDRFGSDSGPTRPPFDSMANLRALGDIQRRGLEAANLVIGRLMGQVEAGGPLFGAQPPGAAADGDAPRPAPDLNDLVAAYASLMSSFLGTLMGAMTTPGASAGSTPGRAANGSSSVVWADPLTLPPTAAGGRSESELWLHNRSGAAVTDVRVHCGDLRRHDGWAIASSTIDFEPVHLDELPDLTSRGIRAVVDVPADTPPGIYRGTVLAANLPSLWLVVELDVVAAS